MKDYTYLLSLEKDNPPEIVADKFYLYLINRAESFVDYSNDIDIQKNDDDDESKNTDEIKVVINSDKLDNEINDFIEYLKSHLHWEEDKIKRFYDAILEITKQND